MEWGYLILGVIIIGLGWCVYDRIKHPERYKNGVDF